MRAVATILMLAAAVPALVLGIQWTSAVTDGGNLFYPGVELTVKFWPASDVRLDMSQVQDQSQTYITIGSYQSPIVPAGETGDWCDGCGLAPPKNNDITLFSAAGVQLAQLTGKVFPPYSWITIQVTGSMVKTHWALGIVTEKPRWYQANVWCGLGAGAWYSKSLWYQPQPSESAANLYLPVPKPNSLRSYLAYQTVYMNISVSDDYDGDFPDSVGQRNPNTQSQPFYNVAYWNLAPFLYSVRITNNQGYMHDGSVFAMTGAAMDTGSSYSCVWNNTRTGYVSYSTPTSPGSSVGFACTIGADLTSIAQDQDVIQLINVTMVSTSDPRNYGWLPFAVPAQYSYPTWRYQAVLPPVDPGDQSTTGLTGGQIFGIIFGVFLGVGLIAFGGFKLYKHQREAGWGGYTETSDSGKPATNSAAQIQYNPSSYQDGAPSTGAGGGGFQAADNI